MAFLSLVSLYMTVEKCWEDRILLVGVAKDTSARDLKRQVLPVLNFVGRFNGGFTDRREDTPDTDRMILQWISLHEREHLKVPWASVEYDTAFKTIVPHLERTVQEEIKYLLIELFSSPTFSFVKQALIPNLEAMCCFTTV